SAVYGIVRLADRLTREQALADQVAVLNPSRSDREVFDLVYQLLAIGFAIVPVVLVCFLLWRPERPHLARLGIRSDHLARDLLAGLGLAVLVCIPGIGFYLLGRGLGIGVAIDP